MTPDRLRQPHDADFVVIDVETACSRAGSICLVGIVGFRDGRELFEWETLLDPCDDFHPMNTRIDGIAAQSMVDEGALAAACRTHT